MAALPLLADFRQAPAGLRVRVSARPFRPSGVSDRVVVLHRQRPGRKTAAAFGFELTFFRNAIERDEPVRSPWDVDQVYLAHFAVSDIDGKRFFQAERLNRAGPGLAGADLEKTSDLERQLAGRVARPRRPAGRLNGCGPIHPDFAVELELTARQGGGDPRRRRRQPKGRRRG